ncbi:ATP-binding protein [Deltaproteobacteria bacterium TL4]
MKFEIETNERRRFFLLFLLMVFVSVGVGGTANYVLYDAAFRGEHEWLTVTAQSQARLIEAMARYNARHTQEMKTFGSIDTFHSQDAAIVSLNQIIDAHKHYKGFGKTGEITLAKREKGQIVFLLSHRHLDYDNPAPVPFDSELAEPMRRALSGGSGTVIGIDYRGTTVLAAYEPLKELNFGIVAKIDLAEIREPFIKAGAIAGIAVLVFVGFGSFLFFQISEPILMTLEKRNKQFQQEITERKQAEESIKNSERRLQESQKKAELASKAKTQFLANMSHEIRTPLNSIIGFSQIVLKQAQQLGLPDDFIGYLNNIETSGKNLTELINNILDLSKIEAGKTTVYDENINLKLLIQSVYHINKVHATQKGVRFIYEFAPSLPEFIHVDRTKLNQILMNLVSNAIKFTPAGKSVQLRVWSDTKDLVFQVEDQGIGIAQEKQNLIFEAFEQADASITRSFGGTGLGLAIAKAMVKLLGGTIDLESEKGEGSIFTVRIPLNVEAVEDEEECVVSPGFSKDNRILMVEDNPMNQLMSRVMFEELGLKLHVEKNGKAGVAKALEWLPDLVLMDMHMPEMDGMEATRQIRQSPQGRNIPIVALSADAFKEQQRLAFAAGVSDYLTKPLQVNELLPVLTKYLRQEPTFDAAEGSRNALLSPLPTELKETIIEEFRMLAQIPYFMTDEISEQIKKIMRLCSGYHSSYPKVLIEIRNAVFSRNVEKANTLIQEVLHG